MRWRRHQWMCQFDDIGLLTTFPDYCVLCAACRVPQMLRRVGVLR